MAIAAPGIADPGVDESFGGAIDSLFAANLKSLAAPSSTTGGWRHNAIATGSDIVE